MSDEIDYATLNAEAAAKLLDQNKRLIGIVVNDLKAKLAQAERDRDAAIKLQEEAEEQIGNLKGELRACGVGEPQTVGSNLSISEMTQKAYEWLCEHAGTKVTGKYLMEQIVKDPNKAPAPSVVLHPLVASGKVQREGAYRCTLYWVEPETTETQT